MKYECPECGTVSTAEEIDNRSKEFYDDEDYPSITADTIEGEDDPCFVCPECDEEIVGEDWEEVNEEEPSGD
jgi:ssDNA-binding Zn-finger/Zn-ribbon topoisomerase 1